MEDFLSLIVFTFPGLIAFFWIQLSGITPTVKYQGIEILALSAVLWLPINAIVLSGYNLIIWFANHLADQSISKLYIYNFNTLSNLSSDFTFITYYVISSIVTGYFLSRLISGKLYDFSLDKINIIRKKQQSPSPKICISMGYNIF
ncbi:MULTISPECIES: hypothetical protein [unclassified Oceanobacillus]|uniref:hypothetical protein n=1 Tax=unclassified Oceanobacillus TaxID=2630292 RepID=UPI00300E673F